MAFSDLGLSQEFLEELRKMEASIQYQAQDLSFALLKIRKYQREQYNLLYAKLTAGKVKLSLK